MLINLKERKMEEYLCFISRSDEALKLKAELGRELTPKELLSIAEEREVKVNAF